MLATIMAKAGEGVFGREVGMSGILDGLVKQILLAQVITTGGLVVAPVIDVAVAVKIAVVLKLENRKRLNNMKEHIALKLQPKEIVISADMLKKRTATIVNEFVSSGNEQEALECLAELPAQAAGFLVTNILEKYVDSIKIPEREMILRLCDVLMPQLHAASAHVEKALKTCENLVCLVDLMVDSKLAPELTGDVMRVLIKGRACRREMFDQLLADLRKANKVDEFGVSDEEFQAAHDRLRSKL